MAERVPETDRVPDPWVAGPGVPEARVAEPGVVDVPADGVAEIRAPEASEAPRLGSWDELVRRFGAPLQRMAAEALGRVGQRPERHRVEDLVQEVYIRLLAHGRGFDPRVRRGPQVLAYLRRVVRSAAIDGLRAAGAAKRRPGDWLPSAAADLIDPAPDPEQRLLVRDRRRRLLARCRAAAGPGPAAARDTRLLALTAIGGWTSREIAAASGGRVRSSTVDAAVCRMRRRLAASGLRLPRRSGGPRRRR